MAIQQHTVSLKLRDDEWKTLGVSRVQAGTVSCSTGLVEGTDFEIDYPKGLVRRLLPVAEGLHTFTLSYEDNAETIQAARTAEDTAIADLRTNALAAKTRLEAIINDPTTTDTAAKVRQVVIDLARAQLRVIKYLVAEAR